MSAVKGSGGTSTPFSQVKVSDYNSTEVKVKKYSVLNVFYKLKVDLFHTEVLKIELIVGYFL